MFPSFITLLTHLCPCVGSASSSSPGPQVARAVCPDCHTDMARCEAPAGGTCASDTGYVDSWWEQVYPDSTIKWQHTFGSFPTHRHEKPVLFTFLGRLIDSSVTWRAVTVSHRSCGRSDVFWGKSQRRPPCGVMNYSSPCLGQREGIESSSSLPSPIRPGGCTAVYLGS